MPRLPGLLLFALALSGCTEADRVSDELPDARGDVANPTGREPATIVASSNRAVRIGEGGPRFDACQATGRVTASEIEVRTAPFDRADVADRLAASRNVHICTRSLDQQWFGIVYAPLAPEGEAGIDCGVSSPVRTKRAYDGPCKSGWVESSTIKLVAG